MNILTIDTVLDKSYIGLLFDGNETYKEIESDEKNYHSAYLIQVLKDLNFDLTKIDYLGVNTGVGSFTGIRVGCSVAKVIADRLNIKIAPMNTIEILSKAFQNKNIMLDARRGSVFYSNDGFNIKLISYDEAKDLLNGDEKFICDGSLLKRLENKNLVPFEGVYNLAFAELQIAKEKVENNALIGAFDLKPTYIQTPPIFCK